MAWQTWVGLSSRLTVKRSKRHEQSTLSEPLEIAKLQSDKSSIELPSFKSPPVVETVLGVQFAPLANLNVAHLGAFWDSHLKDWPGVEEVPALQPQFENFGEETAWLPPQLNIRLSTSPDVRLRIRNVDNTRMVQIQNGRLHYNWLGGHGGEEYPRYRLIRPDFEEVLGNFVEFLRERNLGDLKPDQWEITYVNHIPKGTVWNSEREWGEVFTPINTDIPPANTILSGMSGKWHFDIPERKGRLHVELSHGKQPKPEGTTPELIVLKLTARGTAASIQEKEPSLYSGLDLGHKVIVQGFHDLTSKTAHDYWGILDNGRN